MTPAEFTAAFPQFVDTNVAVVQRHIIAALPELNAARFGALYTKALGNVVAHLITIEEELRDTRSEQARKGNIVSETGANVTIGRSASILDMAAKDPFMRTVYGQEFRRLGRTRAGIGPVVA